MSINFVTLVKGEIIQVRAGGRLRNSIIIPVVAHFRLKAISYEAIISYCSVYANPIFKTNSPSGMPTFPANWRRRSFSFFVGLIYNLSSVDLVVIQFSGQSRLNFRSYNNPDIKKRIHSMKNILTRIGSKILLTTVPT